jgi:hypothetical protein
VIDEVDEVLRALVKRDALTGTEVEVVFDAPTKDWASRRNAPTVDIYLYDIREDLKRREVGRRDQRGGEGIVTNRMQPPRWFKLSYLVTAWTQRPEDEHRLLALMLQAFMKQDTLPADLLPQHLAGLDVQLPVFVAIPPPEDRALSDTWSALGGDLKPSLDLVVVAPIDLARPIEVGPPVREAGFGFDGERVWGPRDRNGRPDDLGPPIPPAEEKVFGDRLGVGRVADEGQEPSDDDARSGRVAWLKEIPRARR